MKLLRTPSAWALLLTTLVTTAPVAPAAVQDEGDEKKEEGEEPSENGDEEEEDRWFAITGDIHSGNGAVLAGARHRRVAAADVTTSAKARAGNRTCKKR